MPAALSYANRYQEMQNVANFDFWHKIFHPSNIWILESHSGCPSRSYLVLYFLFLKRFHLLDLPDTTQAPNPAYYYQSLAHSLIARSLAAISLPHPQVCCCCCWCRSDQASFFRLGRLNGTGRWRRRSNSGISFLHLFFSCHSKPTLLFICCQNACHSWSSDCLMLAVICLRDVWKSNCRSYMSKYQVPCGCDVKACGKAFHVIIGAIIVLVRWTLFANSDLCSLQKHSIILCGFRAVPAGPTKYTVNRGGTALWSNNAIVQRSLNNKESARDLDVSARLARKYDVILGTVAYTFITIVFHHQWNWLSCEGRTYTWYKHVQVAGSPNWKWMSIVHTRTSQYPIMVYRVLFHEYFDWWLCC